jgi:uncharacterized protein (TIGR00369 family)
MTPFEVQNAAFEADVRESFARLTLMQTIGGRLLRVAPGEVDIELPFREDLTQHHGFLAAAVLTAIVDVGCGYAAMTLLPAGSSVLTVEYKANFMAPAQGERMLAQARVLRPGRTVTVCAGDVYAVTGQERTLAATMLATIMGVRTAATVPPRESEVREPHSLHTRAAVSPRRRPWCVCRGGGLRHALRELAGLRG